MPAERISIRNFLRASEIFLQEHDNYSHYEDSLLQAMLSRLSAKIHKTENLTIKQTYSNLLSEGGKLLDRCRVGEEKSLSNTELEIYRRQLEILDDTLVNLKHHREIHSGQKILQKLTETTRLAKRSKRK